MADPIYEVNKDVPPYQPDTKDQKIIGRVMEDFESGKRIRTPFEGQWYINASFIRGQQRVVWDSQNQALTTPPAPSHRVRRCFNLIFPKVRARQAKFLKNRPRPEVKPGSSDIQDILDARMTTKVLDYSRRQVQQERKYQHALQWAMQTGHGYWWFNWNPDKLVRLKLKDEATGKTTVELGKLGDVELEVGSPFEMLVASNTCPSIAEQPWIIRMKVRPIDWIRSRYPKEGKFVKAEAIVDQGLRYEQAQGTLSTTNQSGLGMVGGGPEEKDKIPSTLVIERFERPGGSFPKGRHHVVAGGVLLKTQDELPFEMWDQTNPYPVSDFPDVANAGQYWFTTVVEQVIPLQTQYNILRSKVEEHIKVMAHPKLLVAKQHMLAPGAWSNSAGEIVEYQAHPGIPSPTTWHPPNIAGDVWKTLSMLREEIDQIFHIYPEAEGRVGQSTSGFQTNLLQEATDAVHAPDIRVHEMAIEEAAMKVRRIMKLMYGIPRLISITSNEDQVEAFEFSAADIDDHADIVVQAGSALPDLKGARIQMALELRNSRIFGDPDDPEVNRKVLSMLDIGDLAGVFADARADEERARLENVAFEESPEPVDSPLFCDNHNIHMKIHTDKLKSSTFKQLPPEAQMGFIDHLLWHIVFVNPAAAAQVAAIYQRPVPQMPQPPMAAPGMAPPPPEGQPPAGPPQQPGDPQGPPPQGAGPEAGMNGNVQAVPGQDFGPSGSNGALPPI